MKQEHNDENKVPTVSLNVYYLLYRVIILGKEKIRERSTCNVLFRVNGFQSSIVYSRFFRRRRKGLVPIGPKTTGNFSLTEQIKKKEYEDVKGVGILVTGGNRLLNPR